MPFLLIYVDIKAPNVLAFCWTVALGKIPTIDNVCKRNEKLGLVNECLQNAEPISHLLINCPLQLKFEVTFSIYLEFIEPCLTR